MIQALPGKPTVYLDIEPDASGATYFWAAAAMLSGARIAADGVTSACTQGDAAFPSLMSRVGAERYTTGDGCLGVAGGVGPLAPVMADMSDMPDAAVTLAVVAAFATGTSVIRGVRTLRVKETDRIEALRVELAKLGVTLETDVNGDPGAITINPPAGGIDCSADAPPVTFETYDDHRMAMALSLAGLRRPNVLIADPGCVRKTYPTYFRELARVIEAASGG